MKSFGIATGHELTSFAAEEILHAGGNAYDAAIAALAAMCITEPCMSSLCGAGFALIAENNKKPRLLDFFCQTPLTKKENTQLIPIEVNFGATTEIFYAGPGSIATPGIIAGMFELYERYATLPISELFSPAMDMCKNGVRVNKFQAYDFYLLENILKLNPYGRAHFFENGKIKTEEQLIKLPELSDSLDYIAREGRRGFYEGEIANLFFGEYEKETHLRRQDWKNYQAIYRDALHFNWNGADIYTNPFPAIGGSWMAAFLEFLNSQKNDHQLTEQDHFLQLMNAWTGIRPFRQKPNGLTELGYKQVPVQQIRTKGTSHFSIIDDSSNAISLTTTLGEGSGNFIKDTGLQLNNMLGEEAILPNGINSWTENSRLSSMCTPSLMLDPSGRQLVLGSGGAGRIPFVIAQVLYYVSVMDYSLEDAINAPRMFDDLEVIQVEPGFRSNNSQNLDRFNHWQEKSIYFGGVHAVMKSDHKLQSCADFRRDGHSIVGQIKN